MRSDAGDGVEVEGVEDEEKIASEDESEGEVTDEELDAAGGYQDG